MDELIFEMTTQNISRLDLAYRANFLALPLVFSGAVLMWNSPWMWTFLALCITHMALSARMLVTAKRSNPLSVWIAAVSWAVLASWVASIGQSCLGSIAAIAMLWLLVLYAINAGGMYPLLVHATGGRRVLGCGAHGEPAIDLAPPPVAAAPQVLIGFAATACLLALLRADADAMQVRTMRITSELLVDTVAGTDQNFRLNEYKP